MGFYGKVINYLAKAFSKFKIGNITIQAGDQGDAVELCGDNWISVTGDAENKTISYTHQKVKASEGDKEFIAGAFIGSSDISAGDSSLYFSVLNYDTMGHITSRSVTENPITLNIKKEISDRQQDRKDLEVLITATNDDVAENKKAIEDEALERGKADDALRALIGAPANPDEEVLASGVYIPIENNVNDIANETIRAKAVEESLSNRIGNQASGDNVATGVYAYIDGVKKSILGTGELKNTFDTLIDIQNWIEGDGVNTFELTEAIQAETNKRESADAGLSERIDALYKDSGKTEGSILDIVENHYKDTHTQIGTNATNIQELQVLLGDGENSVNDLIAKAVGPLKEQDETFKQAIVDLANYDKAQDRAASDRDDAIKFIRENYETKSDAGVKLESAKHYIDDEIQKLDVAPNAQSNKYLADISQEDGIIKPVYHDLPFDFATEIRLQYNEASGNLTLPTCFRVYPTE